MKAIRWAAFTEKVRTDVRRDVVPGLTSAISSLPDGMAAGILAGVNPVNGLYASLAGRIFGGLTTSTKLMIVTTTSAGALAAADAVSGVPAADRADALFLLTLIAGVVMIVAGLAKLGRYTRFVSHSVMTGFLTGIAVNIMLSQLGGLTGVATTGSNSLAKAIDVVAHPAQVDVPSLATGLIAIAIVAGLGRTRLSSVGPLLVAMPTLAGLLIFAAVGAIRTGRIFAILRSGLVSQISVVVTFVATLSLSVPMAVATGVAISLVLQLNRDALDLRVVALVPDGHGMRESDDPPTLATGRATIVDVYGSLLYAGARTLQARLPQPIPPDCALVLRMRGHPVVGSTFFAVVIDYAHRLDVQGGRLFLSGVDDDIVARHHRLFARHQEIIAYPADPKLGESTLNAYHDARDWLRDKQGG